VSIKDNIDQIRQRMDQAARAAGRDPNDIKLVAVTKTQSIEAIEAAIQAGITDIGENRVQEAKPKIEALKLKYPQVTWHMVGHLQRNKVRQALDLFDIIQTVDSIRLAKEIQVKAEAKGVTVPILIEVNTSAEETKNGISVDSTIELIEQTKDFQNLKIQGLMTIGPLDQDARPSFIKLRELKDKINIPGVEMTYLSMGMTQDFETAIQEGSNIVRIGRGLFGSSLSTELETRSG